MENAGRHTVESFCNGSLASHIDSGHKARTKNRKDMNIPKAFTGNLVMFGNSPDQYGKRFQRNSCCGIVRATESDLTERKDEIMTAENGVHWVDNMVTWEHAGSKATICHACGWIDSERSNVQPTAQESKEEIDNEPTAEELATIESVLPELIA